mmetsp:Transcript_31864/g.51035  ORF Transcript_31864/g.51035 Transcript_31864/m.51035 type:complete len:147 (+) Transcript_31864:23-463(+)
MTSSVDTLSQGLQRVLAPTVRECDKNVASCAASQVNLTAHIDRLAHELEVLLSAMPEPAVELHADKIRGIRARVDALSASIGTIQARTTRLHTAASGMRRADLAQLAKDEYAGLPPPETLYKNLQGRTARAGVGSGVAGGPQYDQA